MSKINPNMIKGIQCVGSQTVEGDCFKDIENFKHMDDEDWMPYCCGHMGRDFVGGKPARCCPYFQEEFGVCFEDGDLYWLKDLAEQIKEQKNGNV